MLITSLYFKFTRPKESSSKTFIKWLRFDKIMAISLWPHFFGSPCILVRLLDKQLLSQTVESACTKLRVLAVAGCYSHCGLMMARCLTAMSVVCRRPSLARSTTSGAFTLASATFRKPSTCMLSVSVLLADLRTPSFCFAVYCKSVTLVF